MSLGVGIAATLLVAPRDAQACSPSECFDSSGFAEFSLAHSSVTRDGVLVFRQYRNGGGGLSDAESLPFITIGVEDSQGAAVEGALELSGDAFVWRPASEFVAGETLSVAISIDNTAVGAYEGCGFEDAAGSVSVIDAAAPALALPELSFTTSYVFDASTELNDYICCDGSYPEEDYGGCGGEPPLIAGPEGHCVAGRGTGYALALFEASGLSETAATTFRVELLADGEVIATTLGMDFLAAGIRQQLDRVFDAELRVVSLLDGSELMSDASTADGADPEALGETFPDVAAVLAENCETPAYQCDAYPSQLPEGQEWDPQECDPFDDDGAESEGGETAGGESESEGGESEGGDSSGGQEGDTDDADAGADGDAAGCGCTAGEGTGWHGGLLLFAVAGLLRRRRSTR